MKLSHAQEKRLLEALRAYPRGVVGAPLTMRSLQAAGLLRVNPAGQGHQLTEAGLDLASRISAQQIIDAANAVRHEASVRGQEARHTACAGSAPKGWPFPESHHRW